MSDSKLKFVYVCIYVFVCIDACALCVVGQNSRQIRNEESLSHIFFEKNPQISNALCDNFKKEKELQMIMNFPPKNIVKKQSMQPKVNKHDENSRVKSKKCEIVTIILINEI